MGLRLRRFEIALDGVGCLGIFGSRNMLKSWLGQSDCLGICIRFAFSDSSARVVKNHRSPIHCKLSDGRWAIQKEELNLFLSVRRGGNAKPFREHTSSGSWETNSRFRGRAPTWQYSDGWLGRKGSSWCSCNVGWISWLGMFSFDRLLTGRTDDFRCDWPITRDHWWWLVEMMMVMMMMVFNRHSSKTPRLLFVLERCSFSLFHW